MIYQSIKMALASVMASKMRSFLTMLGIIIGVIALVVLVSLVNGATDSVTDQITSLGSDMLTVSVLDDKDQPFKIQDMAEIAADPEIDQVAPYSTASVTMKYGRDSINASMVGTTANYETIQGLTLGNGRFLRTADVDNATYVTVLTYETAEELFGYADVVGEEVVLNGLHFRVVGVLEESDSQMSVLLTGYSLYVPYTTAARMSGNSSVRSFYATSSNTETMDFAEDALERILLTRFRNDDEAFNVFNQSMIMDAMGQVTGTLTTLLGGIAAISLLVGGIGIMNIMLVSVSERTKEIGIRKAIGARTSSIRMQFLIEALVLSMAGCLIGLLLSGGILALVTQVAGEEYSFPMSPDIMIIAASFSTSVGVLFGIYPANKAAKMRPIDALRTA